ncbi:MAG: hypothetical protein ACI9C9_002166 [Marivirga sp.]|jgi:hypothetical protein
MATKFDWNGKSFLLHSKFTVKKLFWGTENVLSLDGDPILSAKGSGFYMEDERTITDEENNDYHIHLSMHSKALSMGYKVRINGELVSSGVVMQENGLVAIPALIIQHLAIAFFVVKLIQSF